MIVQLIGTLVEVAPTHVVLDVQGVGYYLGVSSVCAASLPEVGTGGVTLLCRMIVREDDMSLYGFYSPQERTLFDGLRAISGVGPKLALSVLSTFTPEALASVVAAGDISQLTSISGVGKKTGERLMLELKSLFQKNPDLSSLATHVSAHVFSAQAVASTGSVEQEATEALLSMGFTMQEAQVALEGCAEAGATTIQAALNYALKRLGGAQ